MIHISKTNIIERKSFLVRKRGKLKEVNSSQAKASPRLIPYISMLQSSLLPFLHAELTETKLGGFDKRADNLNVSVKNIKNKFNTREKLTPHHFYFVKFARYGGRA